MVAKLSVDHAEQIPNIGMVRFDRENLPVDLLGFLQAAGLVMTDGYCERFGNRWHSVYYRSTIFVV
jgi:hypothetical protein